MHSDAKRKAHRHGQVVSFAGSDAECELLGEPEFVDEFRPQLFGSCSNVLVPASHQGFRILIMNCLKTVLAAGVALTIPAIVAFGQSQTASVTFEKPAFAQVAAAARVTLRDSAELPMEMTVSVVATDVSGRIRKQQNGSYKYNFHGYSQSTGHSSFTVNGPRRTINAALHSVFFAAIPSFINTEEAEKDFSFEIVEADASSPLFTAKVAPLFACGSFDWDTGHQFLKTFCGPTDFQFYKDDLSLYAFVFDSTGLPVETKVDPFGSVTLLRYRMEARFQKVTLPGDPHPFLIPQHETITIETNKGKLVINSEFGLRK